ncbi:MAG TPA: hypothetical protein VLH41_03360 [Thermoanaerobaculia bacterium]|nr:hypothetical protein [Thermoanaerobaculia bacterium]
MTFRFLLVVVALAGPVGFIPRVLTSPLTAVPCGRALPNCRLGDPIIGVSVLGRAWDRLDRGEPWNRDDRVFAPYPDTWALGEGRPLQALITYPMARWTGSSALGYNVEYVLACILTTLAAGGFFSRLAGTGWPALIAAVAFTWAPARLNNLGVDVTLWGGLALLALSFGLDYLRGGPPSRLLLFASSWLVLGFSCLYGVTMGGLFGALALGAASLGTAARRRRLLSLGAAGLAAAAVLVVSFLPYFRLATDFDARASRRTQEGHAADLASLLKTGAFSGPSRDLLERIVPGFPEGAAAFFPTLGALFALASFALLRRKETSDEAGEAPERSVLFWLGLALLAYLFALGPTIRFLGNPLLPGPWRLLGSLPVLDSMRGLHRWDQWFDLAIFSATTLALAALLRFRPGAGRIVTAVTAALLTFDLWPRGVVADPVPSPSPVNDLVLELPRDAILATYPFERPTSERAWAEQLCHGRRVLTGYQTFPPPIHYWVSERSAAVSVRETLEIYRELGASALEIVLSDLDPGRRREAEEIAARPSLLGAARAERRRDRIFLRLVPRQPVLVDPVAAHDLVFRGGVAAVAAPPGRLAFRLRRATWPVTIVASGTPAPARLTWDLVGVGGLKARVEPVPTAGAEIRGEKGRLIGRAE